MTDWYLEEAQRLLSRAEVDLLIYLDPFLTEQQRQRALDIALHIPDSRRPRTAAALVPAHPETGKAVLLAMVSPSRFDLAFGDLIPLIPEPTRSEALQEALSMISALQDAWWQPHKLLALVPYLSKALSHQVLVILPKLWISWPERERVDVLRKLLLHLAPEDLPKAFDMANAIPVAEWRIEALLAFLPLSAQPRRSRLVTDLLAAARSITDIYSRVGMLERLLPYLNGPRRRAVAAEVAEAVQAQLAEVRATTFPEQRVRAAVALLPALRKSDQRALALEAYETIRTASVPRWTDWRAPAITLIPYLPADLRLQVVQQAMLSYDPHYDSFNPELVSVLLPYLSESAGRALLSPSLAKLNLEPDEHLRAEGVMALAPLLPEPLLPSALAIIRSIEREDLRAKALTALTMHRPEAEGRILSGDIAALPAAVKRPLPGVSPSYLRYLFRQIASPDRTRLLNTLLDRLSFMYIPEGVMGSMGPAPVGPDLTPIPVPEDRIVSTGFAAASTPETPLDRDLPLTSGATYYFWLQVGPPVARSIETAPATLPTEMLPQGARLTVALFSATGDLELTADADVGELQLQSDGTVRVARQPGHTQLLSPPSDIPERRLFFPIRTPAAESTCVFLCNIYYERVLVQSRRVTLQVRYRPERESGALQSALIYSLSQRIDLEDLARIEPHRLSLHLNDNPDGTHCFAFFGAHGQELWKHAIKLSEGSLQDWITSVRKTLRQVAWGDEEPWTEDKAYRYQLPPRPEQFKEDLVRLAIKGWRLYYTMNLPLAGERTNLPLLIQMMRQPGLVLIASQGTPTSLLPASLIYDYPLDTNAGPISQYALCPAFLDTLDTTAPLEESRCFKGDCPSWGNRTVICPSGFWGFRHTLGMPPATVEPPALYYRDPLHLFVGVSTDERFLERELHEQALQQLCHPLVWTYAATRKDALALLGQSRPHLVYFYCHGGWDKDEQIPFLQVGPLTEYGITPDNIGWPDIHWESPRPLVFINGCHTAALEPQKAAEFVSAFVGHANACGVIGTEITVFEPLARAFAEECLRRFLVDRVSIGEAVRGARLALLKQHNPLGLVYIPFVLASLRLVVQEDERTPQPSTLEEGVRQLLEKCITMTVEEVQKEVSDPLPTQLYLYLDLEAFGQEGKELSFDEVLSFLCRKGTFPREIEISVRGIKDGRTLIWLSSSDHVYVSDLSLAWNTPAGMGPFKIRGLTLPYTIRQRPRPLSARDLEEAGERWR